jgi:catechol 2,3-dioxygenase-like lactoylglutathione lyase family enzyme
MTTRAVAFLATSNPPNCLRFYRDLIGITLLEDTPFALVFDIAGTVLRVQKTEQVVVVPYTSFGFEVDDIEAEVRRLRQLGITFERYPHFEQDEMNVWTAPGGARVAWFKDPDGNLLSLSMHDAH